MPVTTTSCTWSCGACCGLGAAACACTAALRPNSAMATAVPINVDLAILMTCSPPLYDLQLTRHVVSRNSPGDPLRGVPSSWDQLMSNIVPFLRKEQIRVGFEVW